MRTVSLITMWLIAMATTLAAPAACASPGSCAVNGTATIAAQRAAQAEVPSCHAPAVEETKASHCGMGGPCCQQPASSATEEPSSTPQDAPSGTQSGACISAAPQQADLALTSVEVPTLDFAAILVPAPAPWIYLATNSHPHSSAPLLPPHDGVARPQGSRAPPASLA